MNILISGKNGYVANCLKEYGVKNRSYNVDLVSARSGEEGVDFTNRDVFIHTAAIVHKREKKFQIKDYLEVNKNITIRLAHAAKKAGVKKFVFISTMAVYGAIEGCIDKGTQEKPTTFYGISKLEAEKALKELESDNFSVTIIRPPMIYGKNAPGNFQPLRRISKNTIIFPQVNNQRSMIYIDNLCEFIFQLIENNDRGIFHPQDCNFVNTSQMVKQIGLANQKNIYLSSLLGKFIKIGISKNKNLKKIFGNLYYSDELSNYRDNKYQIIPFEKAINSIEGVEQ